MNQENHDKIETNVKDQCVQSSILEMAKYLAEKDNISALKNEKVEKICQSTKSKLDSNVSNQSNWETVDNTALANLIDGYCSNFKTIVNETHNNKNSTMDTSDIISGFIDNFTQKVDSGSYNNYLLFNRFTQMSNSFNSCLKSKPNNDSNFLKNLDIENLIHESLTKNFEANDMENFIDKNPKVYSKNNNNNNLLQKKRNKTIK